MNVIKFPVISFIIDFKMGGGISKFEKFVEFQHHFRAISKSRFLTLFEIYHYKKKDFP